MMRTYWLQTWLLINIGPKPCYASHVSFCPKNQAIYHKQCLSSNSLLHLHCKRSLHQESNLFPTRSHANCLRNSVMCQSTVSIMSKAVCGLHWSGGMCSWALQGEYVVKMIWWKDFEVWTMLENTKSIPAIVLWYVLQLHF